LTGKEEEIVRKVVLAIIVLMLVSSVAFTADWKYFGTNNDDSVYSYDEQSLTRGKDTVKVWSRVVFSDKGREKIIKGNPEVSGIKNATYAYALWEIDCSKKMGRAATIKYYTFKGDMLWGEDLPETDFEQIPPGTIMSSLLEAICKKDDTLAPEK
jgi:hypothetical protein